MWPQIYDETWRIQRDFFYDPDYHGLDLREAKRKYAPYLAGIASREELTYLLREALGRAQSRPHVFGWAAASGPKSIGATGLLGADYSLENGRYRIARVYGGETGIPSCRHP